MKSKMPLPTFCHPLAQLPSSESPENSRRQTLRLTLTNSSALTHQTNTANRRERKKEKTFKNRFGEKPREM